MKPGFISRDDLLHEVMILSEKSQILLTKCHAMSLLLVCENPWHKLWTELVHAQILGQ